MTVIQGVLVFVTIVFVSSASADGTSCDEVAGTVDLYGGSAPYEGVARINNNGVWGTVCDNWFSKEYWPSVFCQELGYVKAVEAVYANTKGISVPLTDPVGFQSPKCSSENAGNMAECGQDINYACGHDKDVYVKCMVNADPEVTLSGGNAAYEGVAKYYDAATKRWGAVCDVKLKKRDWPNLVCQQLGYPKAKTAVYASEEKLPVTGPITFHSPKCNVCGADSLSECGTDGDPCCGIDQAVYVECKRNKRPKRGEATVKFSEGSTSSEGLAVVFNNTDRRWGLVCDRAFNKEGWPSVFCKELGFERAEEASYAIEKGLDTTGVISFQSPACNPGNARSMKECGVDKNPACGSDEVVYVKCKERTEDIGSV